jgi:hypothetical protein
MVSEQALRGEHPRLTKEATTLLLIYVLFTSRNVPRDGFQLRSAW